MTRLQKVCSLVLFMFLAASVLLGGERTQVGNSMKRIRVIYSNDNMGYIEPCGCGGRYQGGLARRVTAIEQLKKENPNALIIDSGNTCSQKENVAFIISVMAALKYDAVGIGASETYFPEEFFKHSQQSGLHVISTKAPESKNTSPYIIKKIDGVNVGVISYGRDIAGRDVPAEVKEAFVSAYKAAREKSQVLILLDQGGIAKNAWLESNADGAGAPDIVIAGLSNVTMAKEKLVGKTHIMPTSLQGKFLGVIDIEVASDGAFTMSQKMAKIDKDTAEDPAVKKQIEDYLLNNSKQASGAAGAVPASIAADLGKGKYYSPETCQECHPDEYDQWAKSRHAKAVNTLASKNRLIADCLPCHSEEYRQTLKTTRPAKSLTGVECATCHASVLPHGDDGPAKSATRKVDPKLCITCHNSDRSPDYDEKKYMKKIAHGE